ncbi:MAG: DMT family transporter, partial [Pseudomonadota bacterium]
MGAGDRERGEDVALKGYGAVGFAVLVWAGWIVVTRDQVGRISPLDISIMRYGVPALLLAPIWMRKGLLPEGERLGPMLIMATGWGGGFVFMTSKGLETVPAALFGPMVPATLPLIVSVWDFFVEKARFSAERVLGLALIALSIALIVGPAALRGDEGFFKGAPYLLAAATGWSAFTIAYRSSRLTGMEATAYVCLYSAPFMAAAALWFGTDLPAQSENMIVWLIISQGLLSGIGAVASFGYAVRHLGVARTSSFTSLVPMGAALGAWAVLGETPAPLDWASVACACLGVALVNGAAAG